MVRCNVEFLHEATKLDNLDYFPALLELNGADNVNIDFEDRNFYQTISDYYITLFHHRAREFQSAQIKPTVPRFTGDCIFSPHIF